MQKRTCKIRRKYVPIELLSADRMSNVPPKASQII